VKAIHPDWSGYLALSEVDDTVYHQADKGIYEARVTELLVNWDRFNPDLFLKVGDMFIHQTLAESAPALTSLGALAIGNDLFQVKKVTIFVPDIGEVTLRLGTSDQPTFAHVFQHEEYNSPNLPPLARTIVDLGANIGLSALYFATRYPDARIVVIEPDRSNYDLLLANVASFSGRIKGERAAAWWRDDTISLLSKDTAGNALAKWGLQVSDIRKSSDRVPAYGIGTLLDKFGLTEVDILKVDIEGAELELFSMGDLSWLNKIRLIIVETHERFRPGGEVAVRQALKGGFVELDRRGENLYFSRAS
jgi:FkbM family methyltransferase